MKKKQFLFIFLLIPALIMASESVENAEKKISKLNSLIIEAKSKGLDVQREELAVWMSKTFLGYAAWDEKNIEPNVYQFRAWPAYKKDAEKMAAELAEFERDEVNKMLDTAIEELQGVISGKYVRRPVPSIDWESIKVKGNQFVSGNRPVYINDYFTKPDFMVNEYCGKVDRVSLALPSIKNENGDLSYMGVEKIAKYPSKYSGYVLLLHGVAPKWALDIDPDLGIGSRYFTKYDIDNPNIRRFWETTFKSTIPLMKGKAYTDMGYILSNEPHWFSMQKTWATGVISKYTMEKFRVWLKNKHGNIAHLNKLWNTSFSSFDEVEFQVPFAVNLKGKPAGYDWMSFNMDRVTEWFKFLDSGIKKYDSDAKTHLKIMPHLFSDDKIDHGIDMEALTKLSDIIGNDAKIVKKQWNRRKEKEYWEGVYSFDWKEVTMTYDFCRSVSPNKPNVNSESHYLSSSQYRNLYMTPDFVRSAYWLATLHGMNVNYTWFWAREKDGAIRKDLMNYRGPDNAMNNAYAASVVQQPRVANEVAKTMMDLNAFSSEIAAMQSLKQPIRLFYSKTSVINKWFHMQNLFDLYRKMYFNGVPLGFATEDIINSQKNNLWELIVVSKTEFVTDAEFNSIQKYLDNGGTVIIDSVSLKKNEYGQPRNISLNASKGKLIPMDGIGKITNESFRILEQKKLMPDVFIVEKNGINTKGCMWRVVPTGKNKYVMSIINLGCTDAIVTLKSKKGNIKNVVNLINGMSLGQQFTLTSEKTMLIEIQK